MIEVKGLTKRYGGHIAVDNCSFTINDGEVLGFLGPNGAGKSTTMNIVTGYLSATSGSVTINGYDILENPDEAKRHIGYLPEHPPLYQDMTVMEYLEFVYKLKKVRLPKGPHLKEICQLVKISEVSKRVIKHLSKGYQQRVGIAEALVGNPEVLILDEPTVGLDPKQIIEIRKLISHLGKNHTVILSSHILSEVQAVCERVIVINDGKIIADDTPDNLSKNLSNESSITVRVMGPERDVSKLLRSIPGVTEVIPLGKREKNSYEFNIETVSDTDVRIQVFNRLSERNWPILMLRPSELSLEEIFLRLTDGEQEVKLPSKSAVKEREIALGAVNQIIGEQAELIDDADKKEEE